LYSYCKLYGFLQLLISNPTGTDYLPSTSYIGQIIIFVSKLKYIYIAINLDLNNPVILEYGVNIHTPEVLRNRITKGELRTTLVAHSYLDSDLNTKILVRKDRTTS
jgi:hypothetical protein